jgi:hypothetical protein
VLLHGVIFKVGGDPEVLLRPEKGEIVKAGRLIFAVVASAISFFIMNTDAPGQTTPVRTGGAKREPVVGGDGLPLEVKIREVKGIGTQNRLPTPVYQSNAFRGRSKGNKDWVGIVTEYSTDNEWIDELTFSYYVLTQKKEKSGNSYSLYRANVTYVNIAKDREHFSTMFIHPNAVERYGEPVAIAVIISFQGKQLDVRSEKSIASLPEEWWDSPAVLENPKAKVTIRDGYLLNRSQSPWAMINIDDYEAIKL